MYPTRRQMPKEAKVKRAPAKNTAEGTIFDSAAGQATMKYLQSNPEQPAKPKTEQIREKYQDPKFHKMLKAGVEHLRNYPGDMKLFEGKPAPKGKHAKEN